MPLDPATADRIAKVASQFNGSHLLVLHGSRSRGEAHADSDWDFAFLGATDLDRTGLQVALVDALATDAVDVADLARSSAVLRWHVARDGLALFPPNLETWFRFRYEAKNFWCENGATIQRAQSALLADLGPAASGPGGAAGGIRCFRHGHPASLAGGPDRHRSGPDHGCASR